MAKAMGINLSDVKIQKETLEHELSADEEIELFELEVRKMRESEEDPQLIVDGKVLVRK